MFIREIMNMNSVFCTEETSLTKVYEMMTENGCDYMPVVESRAHCVPIGIITEHDICRQILGKGRNPRDMSARNVMNSHIAKVADTASLNECLNLMNIKQTKRIFVVDEDGRLCGTLSRADIEKIKTEKPRENFFAQTASFEYQTPGVNRIF